MAPKLYTCKHCSIQLYSLKKFKSHISSHWPRRKKIKQENIETPFTQTVESELLTTVDAVACTTNNMEVPNEVSTGTTLELSLPVNKPKVELLLPIFICPQCGREFHHKGPYMRHYKSCKIHSSPVDGSDVTIIDRPPPSNKPMRVQRLRRNSKPATTVPTTEESFQCPVCRQKFFRIGNLLRHLKNSACSSNPSLSHLNVQQSFKKKNSEMNNNVTFPCPHCDKTFNYKSSMKHHMRVHSQLVDYFTCRICKKKFRHGYELESHYKLHVVKSPNSYQKSREKFKQRWSLQLHKAPHTGVGLRANATSRNAKVYRYSCHYCGKSFARKEQSEEHMKVHMLMSTHSCHICGNEYTTRNSLHRHIQVAHIEEPNQVMYDSDSNLYLEEEEFDEDDKFLGTGNTLEEQNGLEADMPLQGFNVTSSVPPRPPTDPDSPGSARLDDNTLCHKVQRFISLLMDNVTLQELIEPGVPVATLLEKVIKYYGLTPVDCNKYPNGEGLRKNCRLLFAALLDDETVDELLIYFMKVASGRLS